MFKGLLIGPHAILFTCSRPDSRGKCQAHRTEMLSWGAESLSSRWLAFQTTGPDARRAAIGNTGPSQVISKVEIAFGSKSKIQKAILALRASSN
jgi:hypothetical protein